MDRHKEIMRLMRDDFDPTPAGWEGRDWYDNAEDVATKIEALFAAEADNKVLREALLAIAASCHRAKWSYEELPKPTATPAVFDILHKLGDQAKAAALGGNHGK